MFYSPNGAELTNDMLYQLHMIINQHLKDFGFGEIEDTEINGRMEHHNHDAHPVLDFYDDQDHLLQIEYAWAYPYYGPGDLNKFFETLPTIQMEIHNLFHNLRSEIKIIFVCEAH